MFFFAYLFAAPLIRRNLFTNKPFFVYFRHYPRFLYLSHVVLLHNTGSPQSREHDRSRLVLFLTDFPRNCHDYTQPCKKSANLPRENRSLRGEKFARENFALVLAQLRKRSQTCRAACPVLAEGGGKFLGLACLRTKIRAGIFGHFFRIYQPNFRTNDQNRNQSRRFQVRRKKKVEPNPDS